MKDRNLIEQIAALKKISVNDGRWRLAFYHIATEFWNLDGYYVIVDKESYENGMKLPLVREYKGTCAVQIFSNYDKAKIFIEETKDMFVSNGKPLIGCIRKGAFQEVFSPFFAEQKWNYMINDGIDMFLDTFERLLAVVEANENYIVNEKQEKMLEKGDIKAFFVDICNDYIAIV